MKKLLHGVLLFAMAVMINKKPAVAAELANENNSKLNKKIERIVALSPHSVEILYALGAGDRIVGTVEYADYPKQALNIPRIGNYVGVKLEKLLALNPDLVIAWQNANKRADLDKLKELGLNIYFTKPEKIDDVFEEINAIGGLLNLEDNAKNLVAQLKQKYQKIKSHNHNKSRVGVFYQLWHDPLRTVGGSSWINSLIEDCNGDNIFSSNPNGYPLVSFESVIAKNPQVIIIPHHSGNVGAKKELWSQWQQVAAVKYKKLFVINGDLLHRYTPRALEGLEQLCNAIHSQ